MSQQSQPSQPSSEGPAVEDGGEGTKWTCGYCTYNNWPQTTKCTICRMPKPIQNLRIEDAVATMSAPYPDISSSECPQMESERWTCMACTYLNWPRSRKCVQCQTTRPSPPTRKISVDCVSSASSDGEAPKQAISPTIRNSSSPPLSTNFQSCAPGTSAHQLDSGIVARKLQKWICIGCTYQNWPKTARCVMCYTPRPGLAVSPRIRSAVQSPNAPSSPQAETNSGSQSPTGSRDKKRVLQDESRDSGGEGTGRKSPKSSGPPSVGSSNENLAAAALSPSEGVDALDRHIRRLRHQPNRMLDFLWLNAVRSVVSSSNGDADHVEAYLAAGGDPSRQLTNSESQMLERAHSSCVFEAGHTLLLLALRYQRDDIVTLLLARADVDHNATDIAHGSTAGRIKRVPCYVSPDTAANIRRSVAMSLRQRKGELPCFYFSEITTFALPASIYELTPPALQRCLFDEVLDRGVQKELEEECAIINWSLEVTDRLSSRLFALWNRTAGDCLLDSVLQATWGVFDSENSLRQALADSLADAAQSFYPRWREYETLLAKGMQYSLDENQLIRDWDYILKLASKPGSALEQAHVFALAHIVRRPIIVYGVRIVKSYRGEHLDYARFEGVYLPLLWESSFCSRSPICLGYTRGHFVALAPMEPPGFRRATRLDARSRYVHLPLQDGDGKLLPVHFIGQNEIGHEQQMLRTWLDVTVTDGGLWCAKMKLHSPPALVDQMIEDWLDYYRRQGQHMTALQQRNASSGGRGFHRSSPTASPIPTGAVMLSPPASPALSKESSSAVSSADKLGAVSTPQSSAASHHLETVVEAAENLDSPAHADHRKTTSATIRRPDDASSTSEESENEE